MATIVFIDRNGKEAGQTKIENPPAFVTWDNRCWGFGVGKLDGTRRYYEVASPKAEAPISATR